MLPGVRIGSLSQVDRSRTGAAAWIMGGKGAERRVASAAFYNETPNVNYSRRILMRGGCGDIATILHRFARESVKLHSGMARSPPSKWAI
jgi:hypothetical protein